MNANALRLSILRTSRAVTIAALASLFCVAGCAVALDESWSPQGRTDSAINMNSAKGGASGSGNAGNAGASGQSSNGGNAGNDPGGAAGRGGAADQGQGGQAGQGLGGATGQGGAGGSGEYDVCGNGVDDDFDGKVDELCDEPIACEDTEGHDCNLDKGYGDRCAPGDNLHGCTPERFWAWCNRRNPTYPNIWDEYLKRWVDTRCDGEVLLEDPDHDGYDTFTCVDSRGHSYECTTPIVIAFDPSTAVQMSSVAHGFTLQPGVCAADWPSSATPWLTFDRNSNGAIDDGSELFGSGTVLENGSLARNGFEALAELDSDQNGRIDSRDKGWDGLQLWYDRNKDGVSQSQELASLTASGLISLELAYFVASRCDGRGNCERERSSFSWSDSGGVHTGAVIDVYLRSR